MPYYNKGKHYHGGKGIYYKFKDSKQSLFFQTTVQGLRIRLLVLPIAALHTQTIYCTLFYIIFSSNSSSAITASSKKV